MSNEGANFEDVLNEGGKEEIRQAAEDVKLFSRKLKRKVSHLVHVVVCSWTPYHLIQSVITIGFYNLNIYIILLKVVEVGDTTLATEKELDELRQTMKEGKKNGRVGGLTWSISDIEKEVELVRLPFCWITSWSSHILLLNIDNILSRHLST